MSQKEDTDDPFGRDIDRLEDPHFLTGEARYTADLSRPGTRHMAVVRSPHAHARIQDIDSTDANSLDGVQAVITANDIDRSGVPGVIPHHGSLPTAENSDMPTRVVRPLTSPDRSLLATEMVRYVGEPVAVVVTNDPYIARDAVELVDVTYERDGLEAVTDPKAAITAPPIHGGTEDNVAFEWERGDQDATFRVIRNAPHSVSVELDHQRVLPSPIEPRAALSEFDPSNGQLTTWRATQGVARPRAALSTVLGLDEDRIRVITPQVGGAFGTKSKPYPAELLTAWCAIHTGKPVKWVGTRTETSQTDAHGRAQAVTGELAFDDEGSLLGLRVTNYADIGAYVFGRSPAMHTTSFTGGLSGQYSIPTIHCRVIGAYTTAAPVGSYRATSRPQAILVLEQLLDRAARHLGIDPARIRRRNFISPTAFPYRTATGGHYDSGDYEPTLDLALHSIGYEEIRAIQTERSDDGTRLGVGIGCATDGAGGGSQSARLQVDPSGEVTVDVSTLDSGQGHRTTFPQILAGEFGVPVNDITLRQGDSDRRSDGSGTAASRSAVGMDDVLTACARKIIDEGREISARLLEASIADIEFDDGDFYLRGAQNRSLSLREVADLAAERTDEPGLVTTIARGSERTTPFATHVAVVEVNLDEGRVTLPRYVAVSDCGPQINPKIVTGQVCGSIVQGIGQVLHEGVRFDESGTLLNGSFQDYDLPRASDVPDMDILSTVTPSPHTPNGVKGIGEVGTSASVAAVANAILDAMRADFESIRLPITDEALWRANNNSSDQLNH